MLKNPHLGYIMLLCHYLASLAVGVIFRNYGKEKRDKTKNTILKDINNIIYDDTKSDGFFVLFGKAVVKKDEHMASEAMREHMEYVIKNTL